MTSYTWLICWIASPVRTVDAYTWLVIVAARFQMDMAMMACFALAFGAGVALGAATLRCISHAFSSIAGLRTWELARRSVTCGAFSPTWMAFGTPDKGMLMVDEASGELFLNGRFYDFGEVAEVSGEAAAMVIRIRGEDRQWHPVCLSRDDIAMASRRLRSALLARPCVRPGPG
jgi:hypothetical protein